MTIKIGDKIPAVTLKVFGASGMTEVKTKDLFADKKVVMFGVVGAFTPTCAQQHLPDYIRRKAELEEKGVDEIICVSVNDPFVMDHWGKVSGAGDKVTMLPDGNAEFTKKMGLDMDASANGLGVRSKRYFMVVENGVVKDLKIEDKAGEMDLTSAGQCLASLI